MISLSVFYYENEMLTFSLDLIDFYLSIKLLGGFKKFINSSLNFLSYLNSESTKNEFFILVISELSSKSRDI
jgi:hypothetical protein